MKFEQKTGIESACLNFLKVQREKPPGFCRKKSTTSELPYRRGGRHGGGGHRGGRGGGGGLGNFAALMGDQFSQKVCNPLVETERKELI